MRIVPERSRLVQALSVIALFVAGPVAARGASATLSPNSAVVAAVAPFGFGLVMFFGILFWVGLGIVTVLTGGIVQLARGRAPVGRAMGPDERLVPPGYLSFVVLGGVVGTTLGVLGAVLSDASPLRSLSGWLGLGLTYGAGLWAAARSGFLPFPEED